jgi:hypothetical protein
MHAAPTTPHAPTIPANLAPKKQQRPLQPGEVTLTHRKLVFADADALPALELPTLPPLELSAPADPSPAAAADDALAALGTAT